MADHKKILMLSHISPYPDIDLDRIHQAVDQAWADRRHSFFQDIVSRAARYLPPGTSDFERGVAAGMILARMNLHDGPSSGGKPS
jgi:hypothetical protein